MKFRDLFTNPDGTLSRTQITIWIAFFLSIALVIAEVVRGDVLTWPVLAVLAGLHVFALLDRANARYIAFKIGRDGAGLTIGQSHDNDERGDSYEDEPQHRRYRP